MFTRFIDRNQDGFMTPDELAALTGAAGSRASAGPMALDIAHGAPTEIDELTGFIVREGDRLKIPVPNCRTVARLVKGLELASQTRVANPR